MKYIIAPAFFALLSVSAFFPAGDGAAAAPPTVAAEAGCPFLSGSSATDDAVGCPFAGDRAEAERPTTGCPFAGENGREMAAGDGCPFGGSRADGSTRTPPRAEVAPDEAAGGGCPYLRTLDARAPIDPVRERNQV